MNKLYKIFHLLPDSIKLSVLKAVILSFTAAAIDLLTLLTIAPIIQGYSNRAPEIDSSNVVSIDLPFLAYSQHITPAIFALTFICLVSISSLFKSITLYSCLNASSRIGTFFSTELYKKILFIPYEKFLLISSSWIVNLLTAVTNQSALASNYFLQLITSTIITSMILISMIVIDINASSFLFISLLTAYLLTALALQPKFISNNRNVITCNDLQLQVVNETIGGIKQIVLSSHKIQWLKEYYRIDKQMRIFQLYNVFYSALPRFILEPLSIIILVLLGVYTYQFSQSVPKSIAIVVTFTVALQKLLPIMQNVFTGWAGIKGSSVSLNLVLESLSKLSDFSLKSSSYNYTESQQSHCKSERILSISLTNTSYKYPNESNNQKFVLNNISIEIESGQIIGIVGKSGSGKTTLMDILCSLIEPTTGTFSVKFDNGEFKLQAVRDFYRNQIALVSQDCHINNDTVASNIAFDKSVDIEKIKKCAEYAGFLSFVELLPNGFNFIVGDNGKSLSGGQKQRLSIARALYQSPSILFLDEATSALDVEVQKLVMNNLKDFAVNTMTTIIMISHRFESLQFCNRIIHLENGKISKSDLKYEDLFDSAFQL